MEALIDGDILRTCEKCKEEKPLIAFVKAKQCKYGRTHCCKDCNRHWRSPQYKEQRRPRAEKENEKNRERKKVLVDMFDNKCHDCGNTYPACVYDFHHIDSFQKDIKISLLRRINDKLIAEINKCIMLCSNCHRIRHWFKPDMAGILEVKNEYESVD